MGRKEPDPYHDSHAATRTAQWRRTGQRLSNPAAAGRRGQQFRQGMGQQLTAHREPLPAMAVGQQAEVADALKPGGQNVRQKAPDKLLRRKRHDARLVPVFVAVVLPLEGDLAVADRPRYSKACRGPPKGGLA